MTELSREVSEVWTRLFDHRPFLNGEIKFMLKEFEEKRGDREVENLFAILENLTDVKDTQVKKIVKGSNTALPVLSEKIDQALKLIEEVENEYLEVQKSCKHIQAKNSEKRQKEWDQFIDDMNFKCQRIDNTFEEKEEELRDLYADLNHKLNINNKEITEIENGGKQKLDDSKIKDKDEDSDVTEKTESDQSKRSDEVFLVTTDLDWLYNLLKQRRSNGEKDIPYLHTLLADARIEVPGNKLIKRNPDLEARCVKLRAQQEARDYRKMTKGVDNVRMRFPEDSISYQLKQMNRELIVILQFIISIFAGFLFGFRGVEWMVGNLDFGFRLLLGVMCALVIALAEIYFIAKKLNEELSVPETVQLGGPIKFANGTYDKPHQD